jgi:hypothetical protein
MDLDTSKSLDATSSAWARTGMMICFAVAVGILIVSLWMPNPAKAVGQGTLLQGKPRPAIVS